MLLPSPREETFMTPVKKVIKNPDNNPWKHYVLLFYNFGLGGLKKLFSLIEKDSLMWAVRNRFTSRKETWRADRWQKTLIWLFISDVSISCTANKTQNETMPVSQQAVILERDYVASAARRPSKWQTPEKKRNEKNKSTLGEAGSLTELWV